MTGDRAHVVVHTIGHSTRSVEAFLALLREHGITLLADVRRYPASRRHPHFEGGEMRRWLGDAGVGYLHLPELGGRRGSGDAAGPNAAWENAGFRGYADHALTPEFRAALAEIVAAGRDRPAAVMCAEAVPWRCHRWIVSDHLVAAGHEVRHVLGPGQVRPHALNPHARIRDDGVVVYPAGQGELF